MLAISIRVCERHINFRLIFLFIQQELSVDFLCAKYVSISQPLITVFVPQVYYEITSKKTTIWLIMTHVLMVTTDSCLGYYIYPICGGGLSFLSVEDSLYSDSHPVYSDLYKPFQNAINMSLLGYSWLEANEQRQTNSLFLPTHLFFMCVQMCL